MSAPRAVLWLTAIGFLGFGLVSVVWPLLMAHSTGIDLPTSTARIDFAATYGGFTLGFGAFLAACARRSDWLQAGLWAGVAALTGLATIRLIGLAIASGSIGSALYVATAIEVGGAMANTWALQRTRS